MWWLRECVQRECGRRSAEMLSGWLGSRDLRQKPRRSLYSNEIRGMTGLRSGEYQGIGRRGTLEGPPKVAFRFP